MHWIALLPPEGQQTFWSWRALQFTPRVAQVDEALVLEVSGSHRLWGGPDRLLRRLFRQKQPPALAGYAQAATYLIAIALLRLQLRGQSVPAQVPHDLPLSVLTAALPWQDTLERTGCRTWGQLRALPRGGLARRFGAGLLEALDMAWGQRPETCAWITLPEVFDVNVELPALASQAADLMEGAQHLLSQLQVWLRARHHGALALELEWTLDLRRLDGVDLPIHERLQVRTAQPAQDMTHLRRLVAEQLARVRLAAPANHLRLRVLDSAPWQPGSHSFLPEDNRPGERLHQFIERLSVRLGPHSVLMPHARADHRPERQQCWQPARDGAPRPLLGMPRDALYPPWLLAEPLPLQVHGEVPHYGGPLRRLTRMYRVETGWWEGAPAAWRDYFIAHSAVAGLVWIYRERPASLAGGPTALPKTRWFLQGFYA
jgi:protein ImuB